MEKRAGVFGGGETCPRCGEELNDNAVCDNCGFPSIGWKTSRVKHAISDKNFDTLFDVILALLEDEIRSGKYSWSDYEDFLDTLFQKVEWHADIFRWDPMDFDEMDDMVNLLEDTLEAKGLIPDSIKVGGTQTYSRDEILALVPAGGCACICYNSAEIWDNREDAAISFMEGMYGTEGAESERYQNVFLDIMAGEIWCWDGVTTNILNITSGQGEPPF